MTVKPETPEMCPACKVRSTIFFKFRKNDYPIFRCDVCKSLYVYPQPEKAQLEAIYSEDYFKRGNKYLTDTGNDAISDINRTNDLSKITLITRYCSSGTLLDVGCAYGSFLTTAISHGFEVQGIEVSAAATAYVRYSLKIEVQNIDFSVAHLPENHFDVVTLWDVLEHLPDPDGALRQANRILKPGGILALSTGDVTSVWSRLMGRYWQLLTPPQHLFFFSPKAIHSMLSQNGFTPLHLGHIGKKATLGFILFKARETFGSMITPLCTLMQWLKLDKKSIAVNLGDIMCVIAEKKDERKQ